MTKNTRNLDANEFFAGSEPKFSQMLSKIQLIKTLNWYTQNKQPKDAEKYAQVYLKKNLKLDVPQEILKELPATFGFVCRIKMNGGELPEENSVWLREHLEEIQTKIREQKKSKKVNVTNSTSTPNVVSVGSTIQERVQEKISEILGDFEGALDDFIISKFKSHLSPKAILQDRCKPLHAKKVLEHLRKKYVMYSGILNAFDTDKEIKESYGNFNKTQIKKIIGFYQQAIADTNSILETAPKKPRATKKNTSEQIVSKLPYLKEFKEISGTPLTSVSATAIIGALQVWTYNTKTRKLAVYYAKDSMGLSVSGTSLVNFDENTSIQKTLRKPEDILPNVLSLGKPSLNKLMKTINSVDGVVSGRISKDTILLRTLK